MNVATKLIRVESTGEADILDLTASVQKAVDESALQDGIITLFVQGSTGALTTIEYEEGLLKDLPDALERIAPRDALYEHEMKWHDGNGHSHVRASIIGPSLTIPFIKGKLTLGTWQQLVFIELDTRRRSRVLVAQIIGE
ncbi:MAG: secondary thiamine-phosphate synthase enzyme YjbQ [Promethearchaeati archaeon SRVP18_Atabeyarchaeia-1]